MTRKKDIGLFDTTGQKASFFNVSKVSEKEFLKMVVKLEKRQIKAREAFWKQFQKMIKEKQDGI
jgi:hypothetical protein